MTEDESLAVLRHLAYVVWFHRDTQWFHGAGRDREIALEVARFVLLEERARVAAGITSADRVRLSDRGLSDEHSLAAELP